MSNNVFFNFISLIFMVGIIILQIFLSKRENKWFGLILPIINIIYSIIAISDVAFLKNASIAQIIIQSAMSFFLCNTSTIILVTIYFIYREKLKKSKNEIKI